MNTLFNTLIIIAMITASACSPQAYQEERDIPTNATYESVIGKSLHDKELVDFIASNHCSGAGQFQLCNDAGMALWIDSTQVVRTVHLYLNHVDSFTPYKGKLPFELKPYDIMEGVEYKLKRKGVGNAGLPDEGSSPDHLRYWAAYKQVGMTIIYNSPFADGDATIYAILVHN